MRRRKGHCNLPNASVIVHNLQAKAEPLMKDMLVLPQSILRELAFFSAEGKACHKIPSGA